MTESIVALLGVSLLAVLILGGVLVWFNGSLLRGIELRVLEESSLIRNEASSLLRRVQDTVREMRRSKAAKMQRVSVTFRCAALPSQGGAVVYAMPNIISAVWELHPGERQRIAIKAQRRLSVTGALVINGGDVWCHQIGVGNETSWGSQGPAPLTNWVLESVLPLSCDAQQEIWLEVEWLPPTETCGLGDIRSWGLHDTLQAL